MGIHARSFFVEGDFRVVSYFSGSRFTLAAMAALKSCFKTNCLTLATEPAVGSCARCLPYLLEHLAQHKTFDES